MSYTYRKLRPSFCFVIILVLKTPIGRPDIGLVLVLAGGHGGHVIHGQKAIDLLQVMVVSDLDEVD